MKPYIYLTVSLGHNNWEKRKWGETYPECIEKNVAVMRLLSITCLSYQHFFFLKKELYSFQSRMDVGKGKAMGTRISSHTAWIFHCYPPAGALPNAASEGQGIPRDRISRVLNSVGIHPCAYRKIPVDLSPNFANLLVWCLYLHLNLSSPFWEMNPQTFIFINFYFHLMFLFPWTNSSHTECFHFQWHLCIHCI